MLQKKIDSLNILGLTQGSNLDVFINLMSFVNKSKEFEKINLGAYVSFARHFENSEIVKNNKKNIQFIKEWEIFQNAKKNKLSQKQVLNLNNSAKDINIWKSIIGDRRLIYGKNCKSIEDYKTRYDDNFLYSLANQFIEEFTSFIDKFKPNIVIGFNPVTFGELLGIEILKNLNIPVLQLHSSRIENYFALHDNLIGTSSHFTRIIKNHSSISKKSLDLSKKFITKYSKHGLIYEGVNIKKNKFSTKFSILKTFNQLPSAIFNEIKKNLNSTFKNDHHDNGILIPWYYENIVQNIRKKQCLSYLQNSKRIKNLNDLKKIKSFAFYPLHSEPEVAIQVLAHPYHKNQIELVRNIAASLPFGMPLIIKEHPRSFGVRSLEFYKRILEIPNAYFCEFEIKSNQILKLSEIVFVISSTIGLEAAILGKPLVILGFPKYLSMPKSMYIQSLDLFNLSKDINYILNNYRYDMKGLEYFIASLIEGSIDIDLYSVLLQKQNRYSSGRKEKSIDIKKEEDYKKLADYSIHRIKEELLN